MSLPFVKFGGVPFGFTFTLFHPRRARKRNLCEAPWPACVLPRLMLQSTPCSTRPAAPCSAVAGRNPAAQLTLPPPPARMQRRRRTLARAGEPLGSQGEWDGGLARLLRTEGGEGVGRVREGRGRTQFHTLASRPRSLSQPPPIPPFFFLSVLPLRKAAAL